MDFQLSFTASYVAMYLVVSLYCIVLHLRVTSDVGRDVEIAFFRRMLWALAIYGVVESVWVLGAFGGVAGINRFGVELSVVNHTAIMAICYYWFCYVEARLHSPVIDRLSLRIAGSIPLFVAIALTASSPWTGWVFTLDEAGVVGRGPLYLLVLIITYAYAAIATVRVVVAGFRTSNLAERRDLLIMATFALPPAIVGVVDSIVPYLPIVAPAFFFSFLFIFSRLQEGQISHDALTGLNNRRRAERYLDEELEHASAEDPFYYVIIDGDSFKQINDVHGHLEGDRALCAIAEAIKAACHGRNIMAARWGGDEFVVMGSQADLGDPEAFAAEVKRCLHEERQRRGLGYQLSVSIGYARTEDPQAPKNRLANEADQMLYRIKQQRTAPTA